MSTVHEDLVNTWEMCSIVDSLLYFQSLFIWITGSGDGTIWRTNSHITQSCWTFLYQKVQFSLIIYVLLYQIEDDTVYLSKGYMMKDVMVYLLMALNFLKGGLTRYMISFLLMVVYLLKLNLKRDMMVYILMELYFLNSVL